MTTGFPFYTFSYAPSFNDTSNYSILSQDLNNGNGVTYQNYSVHALLTAIDISVFGAGDWNAVVVDDQFGVGFSVPELPGVCRHGIGTHANGKVTKVRGIICT